MTTERAYNVCTRCVMDTEDDLNIVFDEDGVCNYCHGYDNTAAERVYVGEEGEAKLQKIVDEMKAAGAGKDYDCLLGISGGVDSSYLAWKCKELDLRPMVVHFDNGWNSELAVQNIENIVNKLGYDLITYVINWEEFKDLQLSFLKASVVDIEMTSDHAIKASLFTIAKEHGIHYLISGFNVVTEGILPKHWRWNKDDWLNIKSIHKQFGSVPLKTYPYLSFLQRIRMMKQMNYQLVQMLNYMDYNKKEVKELITKELDWRDYGGKHYESIITRFYQGYILPTKFGIDKRKAHVSTLICSGQMTREEALQELEQPIYEPQQLETDREFVLKKFNLSEEEFQEIMNVPPREHAYYPSYETRHYRYHKKFFDAIAPLRGKKRAS